MRDTYHQKKERASRQQNIQHVDRLHRLGSRRHRLDHPAKSTRCTMNLMYAMFEALKKTHAGQDSRQIHCFLSLLPGVSCCLSGEIKVVISSNFTSALDVLGDLADKNEWGFLRLDGGTASNQRQSLVDRFNRASPEKTFLFLLSAKAGGVGLNL